MNESEERQLRDAVISKDYAKVAYFKKQFGLEAVAFINLMGPLEQPQYFSAPELLTKGAAAISDRAASRDLPQGERSMARAVNSFNALTGLDLSEQNGWLFMVILKAARATAGKFNADDFVDGAAYFALAGECAAKEVA